MDKKVRVYVQIFMAGLFFVVFPGCRWIDVVKDKIFGKENGEETVEVVEEGIKKEESSVPTKESSARGDDPVILYIDKSPVLKRSDFDKHLEQMLSFYPQLKGAMSPEKLPLAVKKTFLNKLVEQELIVAHAKKMGVERDPEFQKQLDETITLIKRHLFLQFFEKKLSDKIEITDAQVRSEYDKNKKKYIKFLGGTLASAVRFEKAEDAGEFFEKAKDRQEEFNKLGKAEKAGRFINFGRVSQETAHPEFSDAVKREVLAATKLPEVRRIKDGDTIWIVCISDKKDTEYFEFDDIKGQIEHYLRTQQLQEALNSELEKLKKEFVVDVKEDFLGPDRMELPSGDMQEEGSKHKPSAATVA